MAVPDRSTSEVPLEDIGVDGCFPVPDGPGLGVSYDWTFIEQNRIAHHVFE